MALPTILITEASDFSPEAVRLLETVGSLTLADVEREELLQRVGGVEILWIRLRNRIDAEVMDAAPQLRAIVSPTTGLNHIDLAEAERRGIKVLSLRGEVEFLRNIRATAEHTIGLIFALLRHIPAAANHVNAGGWNRDPFRGHEIYEKTAGIVGYGRLGRIVARYLHSMDMRVLATDPWVEVAEFALGVEPLPLAELLAQSDIVTLHVNLNAQTQGFFGREQFAAMKPGAWFINTARGELTDEVALLEALQSGHLAGAALDVLWDERATGMEDHPLVAYAREHSHLILTPHIGGATWESMHKTERFLASRLLEWLQAEG